MRNVVMVLAACSLLGCSSPASDRVPREIACAGPCAAEPSSSPPVITFVIVPQSITRGDDGRYTLGVTIAFTDDDDGPHYVRVATSSFTLEAPLPTGAPNALLSTSMVLPESASAGTLDFALNVVSSSGVESKPYEDSIFLL